MRTIHRYAAVAVLVASCYGVPLALAVDNYDKRGRAIVQASKVPEPTHDWLVTLDQARSKGVKYAKR